MRGKKTARVRRAHCTTRGKRPPLRARDALDVHDVVRPAPVCFLLHPRALVSNPKSFPPSLHPPSQAPHPLHSLDNGGGGALWRRRRGEMAAAAPSSGGGGGGDGGGGALWWRRRKPLPWRLSSRPSCLTVTPTLKIHSTGPRGCAKDVKVHPRPMAAARLGWLRYVSDPLIHCDCSCSVSS